jgi:selenocysteine-specific elongation factor
MKRLVLGVVGHVDHGKTALVRALTGMETDRLPEEKRRGVSIALGFAHAAFGGQIDFIDAPGHERYVGALIGGVTGAAGVLLVVAANEGPKPQTHEHLLIARLLGVTSVLIAVSKAETVAPETAAAVGEAAAKLARAQGLRPKDPVPVSAFTGMGMERLTSAIAAMAQEAQPAADDGLVYLPVDRAFIATGRGVVVTGTLRRGVLTADSELELLPAGRPARARTLQVHGRETPCAEPGQRVAVNLRGGDLDTAGRGSVLASAGALRPSEWLTIELYASSAAPPLANGARLDLLIGAGRTPVRLRLLEGSALEPGQTALAQLRCSEGVAAPARERFILRLPSPSATVAGGVILDPNASRLRRLQTPVNARLHRWAGAEGETLARLLVDEAGTSGVPLARFAALQGVAPARALERARSIGAKVLPGEVIISLEGLNQAVLAIVGFLQGSPQGLSKDALSRRRPDLPEAVLRAALARLSAQGRLRAFNGGLRLAAPDEEQARRTAQGTLDTRLAARLLEGGLSPPDLLSETPGPDTRQALERLVRAGVAVRAVDRAQGREILFHQAAVEAARRRLKPLLCEPGLRVSDIGQTLGVSRKFSVPLLEHLDAIQFTRRRGDRRVLGSAFKV